MANVVKVRACTLLQGESKDSQDSRSEQKAFIVTMDGKPDSRADVLASPLLPVLGQRFATGDPRIATEIGVKSTGSMWDFVVTVDYSTQDLDIFNPNPLLRPDERTISGTSSDDAYAKDYADEPKYVLTSAGQTFKALPKNTRGTFQIVIRGNRASISADWASYLHPASAVNSNSFTVRGLFIGVGQAKMLSMRSATKYENGVNFEECEWAFAVAPDWDQKVEDRGTFEYDEESDSLYPILMDNGKDQVTDPYPLDGTGVAMGSPLDDPFILTFKPQPKKAFTFGWTP